MRRLTWPGLTLASETTMVHAAPASNPDPLVVDLFAGRSALPRRVHLSLDQGQARLSSTDTGQLLVQYDARHVQWPERTRHGARIAQLPDGGSLHAGAADGPLLQRGTLPYAIPADQG